MATKRLRRPNPRLVKIHRSYSVDEIGRLFSVHKNTVRNWIRSGLPTIDDQRPALVHGLELVRFLERRKQAGRKSCPPGHLYCVRCRAPKVPAGKFAEYIPLAPTSGNLRGICPDCECLIHRRVSRAKLDAVAAGIEIASPEGLLRIGEARSVSVNCDSSEGAQTRDNA